MNKKIHTVLLVFLAAVILTACGEDTELTRFKKSIDDFCTRISEIDSSINQIDAQSDDATAQLLARLDFPEEFDYLENLAEESSEYMTEAVKNYHSAYGGDKYDEATAEYAKQNYSRSYKRIQIIISFLHGEEPTDADLSIEYQPK